MTSAGQAANLEQAFAKAVADFEKGRLQKARKALTGIQRKQANLPEVLHLLALIALKTGHAGEAVGHLEKALAAVPDSADLYSLLGAALKRKGRLEDAVSAHQEALSLEVGAAEHHYNLANVLRDLDRPEDAIPHYQEAGTLAPGFADAHFNLAAVLMATGRTADAVAAYRDAITANPGDTQSHLKLGEALVKMDDPAAACGHYQSALDLDPELAKAHSNLGNAHRLLGQPETAADNYRRALKITPDDAELHVNLGLALKAIGRKDEAEQCYRHALKLNPDLSQAHFFLAERLNEAGKYEETVAAYQQGFATRRGLQLAPNEERFLGTEFLYLELTNKCNFHCDFCPSDSQTRVHGYMDLDLAKRLYDEAAEKKLSTHVMLHVMGEPTLHPRLTEILAYGASKNLKTNLVTNGSTLTPKVTPRILDTLYGTLAISLMTPTEGTYRFRGKVGLSWERYIENIRLSVREYLKRLSEGKTIQSDIDLRMMVSKDSIGCVDIVETANEAYEILTEWRDFTAGVEQEFGMAPFNRKDLNPDTLLAPTDERPLLTYQLQHGIVISLWPTITFANTRVGHEYDLQEEKEAQFCLNPFKQFGVLWNGDVTLCCLDYDGELAVGNIKDSSIEDMLNSDKANKLRASMFGRSPLAAACRKCQAKAIQRDATEMV